jgi:hypothetical protein
VKYSYFGNKGKECPESQALFQVVSKSQDTVLRKALHHCGCMMTLTGLSLTGLKQILGLESVRLVQGHHFGYILITRGGLPGDPSCFKDQNFGCSRK